MRESLEGDTMRSLVAVAREPPMGNRCEGGFDPVLGVRVNRMGSVTEISLATHRLEKLQPQSFGIADEQRQTVFPSKVGELKLAIDHVVVPRHLEWLDEIQAGTCASGMGVRRDLFPLWHWFV